MRLSTRMCGHMVIRSRMKNQKYCRTKTVSDHTVAEDRVRRRLILQLLHLMILVKESNTGLQRPKVASVKTVLVINKHGGPQWSRW